MPVGVKPCGGPRYGKPSNRLSRRANLSVVTSLHYLNFYYRVNFPRRRVYERVELLWITSTYLVGMNESGNQKGNLSYLAGTKKRSDSLIQLIFHKRGACADEDARVLYLSNTTEERAEFLCIVSDCFQFCHQRRDVREVSQPLTSRCGSRLR